MQDRKTIIWYFGTSNFASIRMFAGLKRFAAPRGWRVLSLPRPETDRAMRDSLAFWRPDGVVADPSYDPKCFGRTAVVIAANPPASYRGKAVFIRYDAQAITDLAAEELVSLGCRSFAFVGAFGAKYWSRERERTFTDYLARRGLSCAVCRSDARDRRDPLAFQKRLRRFLADLPKPCGLLAAHDPAGRDVLYAAEALGVRVPDELAVCAIDNNTDICLSTEPTLSSVFVDFEHVGVMAGEAFVRIFETGAAPDATYRPTAFIRRGSTLPLARRDACIERAREFIRREAARGISAADVTTHVGLSPRAAQLRFKKATGHTIMDEILDARLAEAQRLLLQGDVPLEAVARLSGWGTLRNFQLHFTRRTGVAPHEWRVRQRT